VPFTGTLNSNLVAGLESSNTEFGNLQALLKVLIHSGEHWAVSGGLGVTSPTARDVNVRLADGTRLIHIRNDAAHLLPFLGAVFAPNDRFFTLGFLQLDIDANGNRVAVNTGNDLAHAGRLYDSTFLMADVGAGYWLHRSEFTRLTGFAPMVELHYNKSLEKGDSLTAGGLIVGNAGSNVEALNLTLGATLEFGPCTNLSAGYITPLGGGRDRQFDGGLRVMLDYRTGRY
jgi:hypothetical protein